MKATLTRFKRILINTNKQKHLANFMEIVKVFLTEAIAP